MTFIIIDEQVFATDTAEEIAAAKAALRDAGLASAPVYVGEPDGLGDSHKNGQILTQEPVTFSMQHYIDSNEALDVRTVGEVTDVEGVYRLHAFSEGVDYCDVVTGRWIWSIGRNKATGEILAAVDTRFYGAPEFECVWLR